ncbi:MAG: hypothetical protein IPM04_15300 [Saprospiraceae bacterium]|nr:hypothetical protein [Candidatus Brachybacter algidus]MBK8749127.1 hypothetical protein [Candidatus Brachybacter algidus]
MEVYDDHLDQLVPSTSVVLPFHLNTLVPDHHKRLICLGDGGEKPMGSIQDHILMYSNSILSNSSWMAPLAFEQFKRVHLNQLKLQSHST